MTTTFPALNPQIDPAGTAHLRVRTAQFGDGYAQSVADGLNNKVQTWPLIFTVTDTDATTIMTFLDGLQGYQSFFWTPPLGLQGYYRCTDYVLTPHGAQWNTIAATFTQVFNP